MNIRGYHQREVGLMTMVTVILGVSDIMIIGSNSFYEYFQYVYGIIAFLIIIISHFIIIYLLFYELKTYHVNEEGIYVKWFGIVKLFYSWEDIKYIRLDVVLYKASVRWAFYNYLICSKLIIKRKAGIQDGDHVIAAIDSAWLIRHPLRVVSIRIDDFKEGQLEEFWSYVPERLKK